MLTAREITSLMKAVGGVTREHVTQSIAPLQSRIAALELQLAAIAITPTLPAPEQGAPPAEDKAFGKFMLRTLGKIDALWTT